MSGTAIMAGCSPIAKSTQLAVRLAKVLLHFLAAVEDGAVARRAEDVLVQAALQVQG